MADKGQIEILGSSVLLAEISLISLEEKRAAVEALIRKSCRILKLRCHISCRKNNERL